jgi:hypothetical protein
MTAAQPILGYPSKTAAVRDMFDNKKMRRGEIADALDMELAQVNSLLFYSKNGKRQIPASNKGRHVEMPGALFAMAKDHAEKRGITPHELFRRIVSTVLDDGIVDAILDDEEPQN